VKRLLIAIAVCLAGTGAVAPSLQADTPVCTLVGCESGIGIEVRKARDEVKSASLCVQDRCKRIVVKRNNRTYNGIKVECTEEITVRGVFTTRDLAGRKLDRYTAMIPMKTTQPNGPGCPPTCFQAGVRFNGAALVVVPRD
jgi:hypothetical protein